MKKKDALVKDKKFCLAEYILFLICLGISISSICLLINECVIASCFALLIAFVMANIIIVFPHKGSK